MTENKSDKAPWAPRGSKHGNDWPSWRYPLDEPASAGRVFQKAEDVPDFWHDGSPEGEREARAARDAAPDEPIDEPTTQPVKPKGLLKRS